jgi:hypothetical protein
MRAGTVRVDWQRACIGIPLLAMLGGCHTTQYFIDNRRAMSDAQVCGNWRESWRGQYNRELHIATLDELTKRSLSTEQCRQMLASADSMMARSQAATGALASILVIGAAARYGSPSAAGAPTTDRQWDWDEFIGPNNQTVWACRGVQTGQFGPDFLCVGPKIDVRWPGLLAPR